MAGRMTPLLFLILMYVVSVGAGLLGSLLGLGGGIIVVPALTLLFGVDIRLAIAASIVSVIATSCGGAARYIRQGLANMRLGMLLEVTTVSGALAGAYLGGLLSPRALYLVFGAVLGAVAVRMLVAGGDGTPPRVVPDALSKRLKLGGAYRDAATGTDVVYDVGRTGVGLGVSGLAGVMSGLLGIGGGAVKVPMMNLAMGVPMKAATATSNMTIGITAATSATLFFLRGDLHPFVAAPVAAGVLTGATLGAHLLPKLKGGAVKVIFVVVLLYVAGQMLYRGWGGAS